MKKILLLSLLPLCACQYGEMENVTENAFPILGIQAIVEDVIHSRTESYVGKSYFSEADQIGLFLPEKDIPYCWTYRNGGIWESEIPLFWPDKTKVLQFSAFYPYRETASADKIPMPDLNLQQGVWSDIGRFDFLVARTSCSYATSHEGKIPFTGESSFRHIYSLLVLRFVDSSDEKEQGTTFLRRLSVEGKGILAAHEYNLEKQKMQPLDTDLRNQQTNTWSVSWEAEQMKIGNDGYTVPLLINPSAQSLPLSLQVSYTSDEMRHTADIRTPEIRFESGKRYKYTVKIKNEGLVLVEGSIAEWEEGVDMGEFVISTRKTDNKFY